MKTFISVDKITRLISGIQQTPSDQIPKDTVENTYISVPDKVFGEMFRPEYGRVVYRHTTLRLSDRKLSTIFDKYDIEVMADKSPLRDT